MRVCQFLVNFQRPQSRRPRSRKNLVLRIFAPNAEHTINIRQPDKGERINRVNINRLFVMLDSLMKSLDVAFFPVVATFQIFQICGIAFRETLVDLSLLGSAELEQKSA